MQFKTIGVTCNALSAVAAYIAAYLWFKSATAKVTKEEVAGGTGNPEIIVDDIPFIASARKQANLSKNAARAAAVAAFFQACGIVAGLAD